MLLSPEWQYTDKTDRDSSDPEPEPVSHPWTASNYSTLSLWFLTRVNCDTISVEKIQGIGEIVTKDRVKGNQQIWWNFGILIFVKDIFQSCEKRFNQSGRDGIHEEFFSENVNKAEYEYCKENIN